MIFRVARVTQIATRQWECVDDSQSVKAIASLELCCSLAQLLKSYFCYVFTSIVHVCQVSQLSSQWRIEGRVRALRIIVKDHSKNPNYRMDTLDLRIFANQFQAPFARDVPKVRPLRNSIIIRHCIHTTVTISAFMYILLFHSLARRSRSQRSITHYVA